MTETTKTPNPLKQARRDKREAKATLQFLREYRDDNGGNFTPGTRAEIKAMIEIAKGNVRETSEALAALQAGEVAA